MNNIFKTLALGATLSLCLAPASFAKPGDKMGAPGGKMGEHRGGQGGMMRRMSQELGLTPAQKGKLETMMKANRDKMRSIRESKSLTPDQKKSQMKAQRESSMARMKAVLTPAQLAKLAAMQAQMKAQMQQRGAMNRPGGKMSAPKTR